MRKEYVFLVYRWVKSFQNSGSIFNQKIHKINFDNFTISIDNQITRGQEDTPKTKSSIRTIDMIKQCEFYLKEQKELNLKSDFVFLNSNNKPFTSSSSLHHSWFELLKKLNFEYRSIYQTRHSFASNMISNGENLLWVSQMLGHKSLDITLQKYSKYIKREELSRKISYLDI